MKTDKLEDMNKQLDKTIECIRSDLNDLDNKLVAMQKKYLALVIIMFIIILTVTILSVAVGKYIWLMMFI